MQDRFKFRAWHKPSNQLFNVYSYSNDYVYGDNLNGIGTMLNPARFDDCILMQCTGLKDKNSTLIYEGDIVKIKNGIFFINYENGSFSIIRNQQPIDIWYDMLTEAWNDDVYPLSQLYFYDACIEENIIDCIDVIGNIYENPELLEDKNG